MRRELAFEAALLAATAILGPWQTSLPCVACDGSGALPIPPESRCRGCGGEGGRAVPTHVEVRPVVAWLRVSRATHACPSQVAIEPGMLSGERITCRGVGAPGTAGGPPGDIIFQLDQEVGVTKAKLGRAT